MTNAYPDSMLDATSRRDSDAVTAIVSRAAIFDDVDRREATIIANQLFGPIHFPRRHTIFRQGDPGDRLFIVVSGRVKVGLRAADGRESLLMLVGPSGVFGEVAMFDPGPRTATATAVTDTTAVSMDRDVLRAWIAARPDTALQLLQMMARRLSETQEAVSESGSRDTAGRVAKLLLSLAAQFGTAGDDVVQVAHGLTQEEIAQLVGATRETVNKALVDFNKRGWIQSDGHHTSIMDSENLRRRARLQLPRETISTLPRVSGM